MVGAEVVLNRLSYRAYSVRIIKTSKKITGNLETGFRERILGNRGINSAHQERVKRVWQLSSVSQSSKRFAQALDSDKSTWYRQLYVRIKSAWSCGPSTAENQITDAAATLTDKPRFIIMPYQDALKFVPNLDGHSWQNNQCYTWTKPPKKVEQQILTYENRWDLIRRTLLIDVE